MTTALHVHWTRPPEERRGTPLLVLLHGYGADETDLAGLADHFPAEFTLAAVRGPLPAVPGFAWFPIYDDMGFDPDAVISTTGQLSTWLDGVRADHAEVVLLGFSQGMMMASSLARHRPADIAAVVGLSGCVVPVGTEEAADFFHDRELAARRMPFFWGRDQEDPVIPQAAIAFSNEWLNEHTVLTKVLYAQMWHGICAAELRHVAEFLRAVLTGNPAR